MTLSFGALPSGRTSLAVTPFEVPPSTTPTRMPSIATADSPASSSRRRTRSSPTNTLHSTSSNSALVYPVPDNVAWLEQLSLSVTSGATSKAARLRDASFELHVDHAKAKVAWVHARSFDEYRQFQHRLQKALRHGHFCHAECPWLYTFVKSYFPKSYILGALLAPKQVLQTRREALERFVRTLQTFVLNRSNHCCSVLTSAVADEVLAFVNGDVGKAHQCRLAPKISSECAALAATGLPASSSGSVSRRSWDSLDTGDSDRAAEEREESEAPPSSTTSADEDDYCPICHSHLGDEAHSPTNGSLTTPSPSPPPPVASSSTVSSSVPSPPVSSSDACTDSAASQSPDSPAVSPVPVAPPTSHTNATALPPRAPPRRSSSQPRHHFYTTKLACGHRFHDECIVPKLNESMSCPVCGHAEH